jgi:hypothetical protein
MRQLFLASLAKNLNPRLRRPQMAAIGHLPPAYSSLFVPKYHSLISSMSLFKIMACMYLSFALDELRTNDGDERKRNQKSVNNTSQRTAHNRDTQRTKDLTGTGGGGGVVVPRAAARNINRDRESVWKKRREEGGGTELLLE